MTFCVRDGNNNSQYILTECTALHCTAMDGTAANAALARLLNSAVEHTRTHTHTHAGLSSFVRFAIKSLFAYF